MCCKCSLHLLLGGHLYARGHPLNARLLPIAFLVAMVLKPKPMPTAKSRCVYFQVVKPLQYPQFFGGRGRNERLTVEWRQLGA